MMLQYPNRVVREQQESLENDGMVRTLREVLTERLQQ